MSCFLCGETKISRDIFHCLDDAVTELSSQFSEKFQELLTLSAVQVSKIIYKETQCLNP